MDTPLVSVVMPIYNGLPYLIESVTSVTNQHYPSIELVLVDGGSSDGSREWIESFEHPRVVKDYLPKGTPAAVTWTRASELASGEYVKLLCQDDLIYPEALERQVADLQAFPTADMSVFKRDIISATGHIAFRGRGCTGLPDGLVPGASALLTGARAGSNIFGEPLAVLFRRQALLRALPWEDEQPFLLDMFLYFKVLRDGDLVVRHESLGAFRVSTSSWSTRLVNQQRQQFVAWQRTVELEYRPPTYRVAEARLNNLKTSLLRRAAYTWLRATGRLTAPEADAAGRS